MTSFLRVYVGAYTADLGWVQGKAHGIALYQLDLITGEMRLVSETPAENPSFLAFHPSGKFLFAVNEDTHNKDDNAVSAFSVQEDGSLVFINQQPSLGGAPCFVTVEPSGRYALTANYLGGNFVMYPIDTDGRLGPAADNIIHTGGNPHAHSLTVAPGGAFALGCDLGLDRVFVYRLDTEHGRLVPHAESALPHGSGPRHLAFHPRGNFVYVINELGGTLTVYQWDGLRGQLTEVQTISTLPPGFGGRVSCADVHVHPGGHIVYASNRGHDSIAIFAVEQKSGRLTLVGHEPTRGKTPRNFALTPDGSLLLAANQDSDNLAVFRIEPDTGCLSFLRLNEIPTPVCLLVQ